MGKTLVEVTNTLLTEGFFACCPQCRFFDCGICPVEYPHEGLSCWELFQEGVKGGEESLYSVINAKRMGRPKGRRQNKQQ
jgi:hypothetical protein